MNARAVQEALEAAGDLAGAFLWRRVCRDLDGGLRIGLAARDDASARRALAQLPEVPGGEWVLIPVEHDGPASVGLGAQDRLLGVHALVYATPMTAALGTTDRDALASLGDAGAPGARALTVGDAHLLERLSDDPEREREAVYTRIEDLLPDGWPLVRLAAIQEWIRDLADPSRGCVARRRDEVGRLLLDEGLDRLDAAAASERERLAEIEGLLAQEDASLAAARKAARRVAAHTLAVVRRQTEALDLDLQAFLRTLEADLPTQIGAVDVRTARTVLPHWLAHVTESWMADRLARWRADVLAELEEIEIEEAVHAELLVPALQPAPVRGESQWARRLGSTAAFGGAAALLAFGMWLPGLVALAGGVVWSTFGRSDGDAVNRERLVATARTALRQMGSDAQRLLGDQVAQLSEELDRLADDSEAEHRAARAALRADLTARRAERERVLAEVTAARGKLAAAREDMAP